MADKLDTSGAKFAVGDDLYVRDPSRFVAGATCIIGPVQTISREGEGWAYTISADIGRIGRVDMAPEGQALRFAEGDLGLRLGTPISRISGRPGHPGYDEFKRIASSWGHD